MRTFRIDYAAVVEVHFRNTDVPNITNTHTVTSEVVTRRCLTAALDRARIVQFNCIRTVASTADLNANPRALVACTGIDTAAGQVVNRKVVRRTVCV